MEPNYLRRDTEGIATARLLPGLILVGIGALFLLNNLHIVFIRDWIRYWPAILIAIGLFKMVDSNSSGDRIVGGILTVVGALFLGETLGIPYLGWRDFWPLTLIAIGLLLLVQRLPWSVRSPGGNSAGSPGTFGDVAIFGGNKRVVTGDFLGGKVTAIFGGVELDLRRAVMPADSAELEVSTIFGGVSIRVPEHWSVVADCPGVFGGFSDQTRQPDLAQNPRPKQFVVKGAAVFGGVEVKN
jgi:predicted membrane protein